MSPNPATPIIDGQQSGTHHCTYDPDKGELGPNTVTKQDGAYAKRKEVANEGDDSSTQCQVPAAPLGFGFTGGDPGQAIS